ncbi:MAG: Putative dioxygenase [Nitrospira sp.]|nr:MAG: Putative dioxygenase [Nitrospira sp.]
MLKYSEYEKKPNQMKKNSWFGPPLSRREALTLMGAAGAGLLVGEWPNKAWPVPSTLRSPCIVRPEQTEGPYFVDERLHRSDIRTDSANGQVTPGALLALTFQVMRFHAGQCRPIPDAQVDVWHCDAMGVYSDVQDPGFKTLGLKFLRGYQITDAEGSARFLTIYPGWYPIRTVHIHFKIRTASVAGRNFEFTSQLYFPDELTDRVHTDLPYSSKGQRRVRNQHDFIFRDGGNQLMLIPSTTNGGYAATFPIGLELP